MSNPAVIDPELDDADATPERRAAGGTPAGSLPGRAGWVLGRALWWGWRAAWRSWRAVSWVFRSKWRLLMSTWLMGFFLVGQASTATADGLINGPDLGTAGGQTVFERFGPEKFSLYLHLSNSHHGGLGIEESMWTILHAVETGLMYLIAALARGAITSMQWMFNLTLYSDNQQSIDSAVSGVANAVFWPLFGTTLAIGAMVAYGRMKREGGGSLWNDASWLIAASVFAAMFATAPSLVLKDMDNARTLVSDGLMTGYAKLGPVGQSSAGFPPITLPKDQNGAVRQLSDGMWNTFVVTPWCYANFNDMNICRDVGKDYLTDSPRWQSLDNWMSGASGSGGNSDESKGAYCPKELNAQCDWIRGQSFGRLGALLFILIVTIPLVLMLLALVLYGLMAIFGFLLLALAGIVFLLFWMIPGRPRQIGVRWLEELIGALLQSIIITTVIGSVMVLDSFLSLAIPKYGFFAVGLFTFATFITGFRMRGRLENVVGMGAGSGASPFSGYMAMRGVAGLGKALGRGASKTGGLGAKGATGVFRAGRAMGEGMVDGSPLMGGAAARTAARLRVPPLRSRPLPTNPRSATRPAAGGPSSTGPGRAGRHSAARTGSNGEADLAAAAAGTAAGTATANGHRATGAATPGRPAASTSNGAAGHSVNGAAGQSTTAARNGHAAATSVSTANGATASNGPATGAAVSPVVQSSPGTGQRSSPGRAARVELYPSPPARSGMSRPRRATSAAAPPPRTPAPARPLVSRPLPVNPKAPANPIPAGTPQPSSPASRPAGVGGRSTPAASSSGPSSPAADRAQRQQAAQQPARSARVGQPRPTPQPPSTPRPATTSHSATPPQPASQPRTPRPRPTSPLPPSPPTRVRRERPDDRERPR